MNVGGLATIDVVVFFGPAMIGVVVFFGPAMIGVVVFFGPAMIGVTMLWACDDPGVALEAPFGPSLTPRY